MNELLPTHEQLDTVKEFIALIASDKNTVLPPAYKNNPSNLFVAIQWGAEIGLTPMASVYNINVIQGRPTLSTQAMVTLARRAGHKVKIQEMKDKDGTLVGGACTIIRKDMPDDPVTYTFTLAEAQALGLMGRDNWHKQPATMCMWRAASKAIRFACTEIFGGIHSTEEMADTVTAQVVDDPPKRRPSAYKTPQPQREEEPEPIQVDETTGEIEEEETEQ